MAGNPFVTPIDTDTLYIRGKRKLTEAVNLIKGNRRGKIKRRTCVDGSELEKLS